MWATSIHTCGGEGRNGQAGHAIRRPSVRGRARCPETTGVRNTAGEQARSDIVPGHPAMQKTAASYLIKAVRYAYKRHGTRFSSPLGASTDPPPPPPTAASPPAECRRMCLRPPAPQPSEALARTSATEDGVQNLQGGGARRKQRRLRGAYVAQSASGWRMATVVPSQRAAATHERKKSIKVGGGGTLAGRTG